MDDCRIFEQQISASLDGELSREEETALREHLRRCESCRAYARVLERLSAAYQEDIPAPPAMLGENIMAAVRAAGPIKKKKAVILPFPRRVGALAAAAALVLLAGWAGSSLLRPKGAVYSAAAEAPAQQAQEVQEARRFNSAASAPAPAAPAAGMAAAEEKAAVNGSARALFDAEPGESAPDAGSVPFILRSADGQERSGADCTGLWSLGESAESSVPEERAPDYRLLDEHGAELWQLWEEGDAVLFREGDDGPLYRAPARELWEALGELG